MMEEPSLCRRSGALATIQTRPLLHFEREPRSPSSTSSPTNAIRVRSQPCFVARQKAASTKRVGDLRLAVLPCGGI